MTKFILVNINLFNGGSLIGNGTLFLIYQYSMGIKILWAVVVTAWGVNVV